jgi:predicted GTPase
MPNIHAEKQNMRTICEVHREIYRELKKRNPDDLLLGKLEEAFNMAKKMNNKLRQYKYNYDDDWWEENKNKGDINLKS